MLKERFEEVLVKTLELVQIHYGERLVTLAAFGSVARGSQRPDSDVDLLLVGDPLPTGRMRRIAEFEAVEQQIAPLLSSLRQEGIFTSLSVVLKTPAEVMQGGALYLDMVDDARILYDRGNFFKHFLDHLRDRLSSLRARRIWRGNAWYWDLKPDFTAGEVFEL
jgi:predicted nucleotidyltransferase